MRKILIILTFLAAFQCEKADAASVRRRYVPPVPVQWGEAMPATEVQSVEPRPVSFVQYGRVIDINSNYKIDRIDIYSINGTLLSSRRLNDYQTSIETGDFDAGMYIVVTRFVDGWLPAVNKFVK